MTHDDLAIDLAAHLRGGSKRVTWCDMQLGESGSPRPDVYTMEPTYTRLSFEAFEVKVSVADFRRDVTAGKWQSYLKYANSVTFAVPHGLVNKADVPSTCGLIVRNAGGWRYVKKPVRHVLTDIPWKAWIKLLLDGTQRSEFDRKAQHFSEWCAGQALGKKWGAEVAELVRDVQGLPGHLEYRRKAIEDELTGLRGRMEETRKRWDSEREQSRERCSDSIAKLAVTLGLPQDALLDELRGRADQLVGLLAGGEHRWNRSPLLDMAERMEKLAKDMRAAGETLAGAKQSPETV